MLSIKARQQNLFFKNEVTTVWIDYRVLLKTLNVKMEFILDSQSYYQNGVYWLMLSLFLNNGIF